MKKYLFFILICLFSVGYFNDANAVAQTTNRVGSSKALLPQKNMNSAQSTISGQSIATTITNTSKNTSEPTVILSESSNTERLGLTKKFPTKTYTSPKTDTTSIVIPSDIISLYNQIESLQNQLANVQTELARKAEQQEVAEINNTITNKIDRLDTKITNVDDGLENKLETHLAKKEFLTKTNLDEELTKKDFVKNTELPSKGFLTNSDLSEKVDKILKNKNYLTNEDKEDLRSAIVAAKTSAVAEADSAAAGKFVNAETLNTRLSTVANDIATAKTEAINTAKNDAQTKINNLDDKITNVASNAINENVLRNHFDNFLNAELENTSNTGKFRGFLTTADKVTLDNAIASARTETQNKIDALDNKFEGKGAVAAAFDTTNENSILSRALKDTSEKGLGKKFQDIDTVVATNKTKLDNLDTTINNKIDERSFVTLTDIQNDLNNETNGVLGSRIKTLDTRISTVASEGVDSETVRSLLNTELGDNGLIGKKLANLDDKFAGKDEIPTDAQLTTKFGSFLDTELGKTTNNKFGGFAKNSDITADALGTKLSGTFAGKAEINADALEQKLSGKFAGKDEIPTDAQLTTKFGSFLDTELSKTNNNKFGDFAKNSDITADALGTKLSGTFAGKAEINADALEQKLSGKFAGKDEIPTDAQLTTKFGSFLDTELSKTTNNKFGDFAKNSDITADALGTKLSGTFAGKSDISADNLASTLSGKFLTGNQLQNAIDGTDTSSALATTLNTKFGNFATTTELNNVDGKFSNYATTSAVATAKSEAIQAAAQDAETKANQALADAKTDASSKYATTSALNTVDGKFANYSTTNELTAALNGTDETSVLGQAFKTRLAIIESKIGASQQQQLNPDDFPQMELLGESGTGSQIAP